MYFDLTLHRFHDLRVSLLDLNHGAEIRIYEQLITPGGRLLAVLQADVVVTENLNEDGLDLVDGEKASRTSLVAVAEVQGFLRIKLVRRSPVTDFPRSSYLVGQDSLVFPLATRKLA